VPRNLPTTAATAPTARASLQRGGAGRG